MMAVLCSGRTEPSNSLATTIGSGATPHGSKCGYSGIHSDEPGTDDDEPPVAAPVRRALMRTYGA